ncbi:MAG TPA: hypothetical protein VGH03_15320, partial [Caulobacteraceae bacterium]
MAEDGPAALKELANTIAADKNADLLVFNYEVTPPVDFQFMGVLAKRQRTRKNAYLFLTTEGGSADSAFRIMRFLQARYDRITVVVA